MSDIKVTDWTIPGSDGQPIYGNTHRTKDRKARPKGVFVACHGFKGYKDYGFFEAICNHAAQHNLIGMRFNFSHSGVTHDYERFEHPELFEKDTWGKQIEDVSRVIEDRAMPIATHEFIPIFLFGHSRGGVTSLLFASRFRDPKQLGGLITAAAPDYASNLDDLQKNQLRTEGRLLSPSGRTGQDLYVGLEWLEEIDRAPEFYDPVLAAAHIKCPMLILHGDNDDTVPIACAHQLHNAATPNSTLEIIEGANHVFNCPNPVPAETPLEQLPIQTNTLIHRSVDFALRCCQDA